jgi:hypothetical protein
VASTPAYAVACIELLSRLWAELERLPERMLVEPFRGAPAATLDACETLRLELVLLLEACDSPLWQQLLSAQQRRSLRCTLEDVLSALTGGPAPGTLELAQQRLLREVLNHCATLGYPPPQRWCLEEEKLPCSDRRVTASRTALRTVAARGARSVSR